VAASKRQHRQHPGSAGLDDLVGNVSRLRQASTFTLSGAAASGMSGFGSLAGAPIVESGVVYIQDLDANGYALALSTGKPKWEHE
jgi:outer membrane protein assembly factor BamB